MKLHSKDNVLVLRAALPLRQKRMVILIIQIPTSAYTLLHKMQL